MKTDISPAVSTELANLPGVRSKHTPFEVTTRNGGGQLLFKFPNGYGASLIIGGSFAYGGLELAVIEWGVDGYSLVYDTPITDDVIGYLIREDIEPLLDSIHALPARIKAVRA